MGMDAPKRKSGKKHRKYGRAGRRPSHNRYNMEERWEKNKARRIAKQAKKEAKKREKLARRKNQ
jgi:hypothetical protein